MNRPDFGDLDLAICRARIVLSLIVLLSIYVDPTTGGGLFGIDKNQLITLALHFSYSTAAYLALTRWPPKPRLLWLSTALDILFATVLALFTEGPTSPALAFFLFAIIAAGCRTDLTTTLFVTLLSVAMYLLVIGFSTHGVANPYLMRAAYLAIAGYLIDFFGQQRAKFEARMRDLETAAERETIARSLHDGYIQALAGINLRLESCRDMLILEQPADALAEVTEMQMEVTREYDDVRAYVRSLARAHPSIPGGRSNTTVNTQFRIQAAFAASGLVVEQILQIMLEGMRNTRLHGRARAATIDVRELDDAIRVTIDDDGVGFEELDQAPWTIASRVAEFGGHLKMNAADPSGAHLEIDMPRALK